jgi:DNA-binding response OmpR family regulator
MPDLRILVVEDNYLVADDLRQRLQAAGAVVIGPVPSVAKTEALLRDHAEIDCAVLDVNLGEESVLPLADHLSERGVPFVFLSGYGRESLPLRFASAALLHKPFDIATLEAAIDRIRRR